MKTLLIVALAVSLALNAYQHYWPGCVLRVTALMPPPGPWQCLEPALGGIPLRIECVHMERGLIRGLKEGLVARLHGPVRHQRRRQPRSTQAARPLPGDGRGQPGMAGLMPLVEFGIGLLVVGAGFVAIAVGVIALYCAFSIIVDDPPWSGFQRSRRRASDPPPR